MEKLQKTLEALSSLLSLDDHKPNFMDRGGNLAQVKHRSLHPLHVLCFENSSQEIKPCCCLHAAPMAQGKRFLVQIGRYLGVKMGL